MLHVRLSVSVWLSERQVRSYWLLRLVCHSEAMTTLSSHWESTLNCVGHFISSIPVAYYITTHSTTGSLIQNLLIKKQLEQCTFLWPVPVMSDMSREWWNVLCKEIGQSYRPFLIGQLSIVPFRRFLYCVNVKVTNMVKFTTEQAMKTQTGSNAMPLRFFNLGTRWLWVVNATP
jgi:hypothetical protein